MVSKTRKQAQEVLDRIVKVFMPMSVNLQSEVSEVVFNGQESHIEFYNGSRIFVATANDNARHYRATMLIRKLSGYTETCSCNRAISVKTK